MRPRPYIGISGIMHANEMHEISKRRTGVQLVRPIAFGVLTSAKTLNSIPNKYPNRYPSADRLASILHRPSAKHNLLVLHYSADNDQTLCEDVGRAVQAIGGVPDGLQINMGDKNNGCSPNPDKVAAIATMFPHMRIILQIAPTQFVSRASMIWYVREYAFLIADVLFDGSCGNGIDYFANSSSVENMMANLSALRSAFPHLGLGIAGGLSAATLPQIAGLLRDIPDLSIDAEGRLRDADDHLDVGAAFEYVKAANTLLGGS